MLFNWDLSIPSHNSYRTKAEFNNCFILHSKYFLLFKGVSPLHSLFFRLPNITQPCPQVFSVNGSKFCSGLHFWRHWFNMTKILSKFGEQQLVMGNYACGFNQSETGKYFEWIIIQYIGHNRYTSLRLLLHEAPERVVYKGILWPCFIHSTIKAGAWISLQKPTLVAYPIQNFISWRQDRLARSYLKITHRAVYLWCFESKYLLSKLRFSANICFKNIKHYLPIIPWQKHSTF